MGKTTYQLVSRISAINSIMDADEHFPSTEVGRGCTWSFGLRPEGVGSGQQVVSRGLGLFDIGNR